MEETLSGQIRENGQPRLGIPTGIAGGGFALTRLTALRGSPGWVVGPDGVREWKLDGFIERDGRMFLYGPWLGGLSLEEVLDRPLEQLLPLFDRMVRALLTLQERSVPLFDLQTDAVFFLDDGGVLFLPPRVMRRVTDSRSLEHRNRVYHEINHNGLGGEQRVSFALGALLYRAAVGVFPFHEEMEEQIQDRMRRLNILPPSLAVPGIRPGFSEFVLRALGRAGALPGLEEWRSALSDWTREGVFRPLGHEEKQTLEREAAERRRKDQRSFRRRLYWRRNWKTAVVVAAAVLTVGWLAGSMARNLLAPRSTRGLSPVQVVETFYLSQNRLDHQTMEDCLARGVGKADVNEVLHLYVLSRVSMGYEGRSSLLPADEWTAAGRPALEEPQTVFGVTGLRIQALSDPPEPVFEAVYEKWTPEPASDTDGGAAGGGPGTRGYRVRDRLTLRQDRGDWVIGRLERLEAEPLPRQD